MNVAITPYCYCYWWFGLAAMHWPWSIYFTPAPADSGINDCLVAGKPAVCITSHNGQFNLPTLRGIEQWVLLWVLAIRLLVINDVHGCGQWILHCTAAYSEQTIENGHVKEKQTCTCNWSITFTNVVRNLEFLMDLNTMVLQMTTDLLLLNHLSFISHITHVRFLL